MAHAPDGTIEAVAVPAARMFGVEWHPELLAQPGSSPIFSAFAEGIRAWDRDGGSAGSLP